MVELGRQFCSMHKGLRSPEEPHDLAAVSKLAGVEQHPDWIMSCIRCSMGCVVGVPICVRVMMHVSI